VLSAPGGVSAGGLSNTPCSEAAPSQTRSRRLSAPTETSNNSSGICVAPPHHNHLQCVTSPAHHCLHARPGPHRIRLPALTKLHPNSVQCSMGPPHPEAPPACCGPLLFWLIVPRLDPGTVLSDRNKGRGIQGDPPRDKMASPVASAGRCALPPHAWAPAATSCCTAARFLAQHPGQYVDRSRACRALTFAHRCGAFARAGRERRAQAAGSAAPRSLLPLSYAPVAALQPSAARPPCCRAPAGGVQPRRSRHLVAARGPRPAVARRPARLQPRGGHALQWRGGRRACSHAEAATSQPAHNRRLAAACRSRRSAARAGRRPRVQTPRQPAAPTECPCTPAVLPASTAGSRPARLLAQPHRHQPTEPPLLNSNRASEGRGCFCAHPSCQNQSLPHLAAHRLPKKRTPKTCTAPTPTPLTLRTSTCLITITPLPATRQFASPAT
jgi:hypothetical protein